MLAPVPYAIRMTCGTCHRWHVRSCPPDAPIEQWCKATGWPRPDLCSRCAGDPVAKLQWSWSLYDSFDTCPQRHLATRVEKTHVDAPNEGMARGDRLHKSLEKAIRDGQGVEDTLLPWWDYVQKLRANNATTEARMALTSDFTYTAWYNDDVWLRVIADVKLVRGGHMLIIDWKSGKPKALGMQPKILGAAFLLASFNTSAPVEQVDTQFMFLDAGPQHTVIDAIRLPEALAVMIEMRERLQKIVDAKEASFWPPKPGWPCERFCPVIECKHHGRKMGYK